jgi:hypothetical protein
MSYKDKLCIPAFLTQKLNFKKSRIGYLIFLFIVIAILCVTLLQQTISIPEPLCYYNDIKQLQNNQATINNLIINPDNQNGDDSQKVKKVYYDPIPTNPITQQPDLNPNNSKFTSYGLHCPGGDCSRRVQTLLNNPDGINTLSSEERKTTLMYTLAQLSNYYLPSFNIMNISKNKYVDYINNMQSGKIMKIIYWMSMVVIVVFTLYWIYHAIRKLYQHFNFFGLNPIKNASTVYFIITILTVVVAIIWSIYYFTKKLDKEQNPEDRVQGNVIVNNSFDYEQSFNESLYGFFITLIFTCILYWAQRAYTTKSNDTISKTFGKIPDYWIYLAFFVLYSAGLLITSGFLLYFVFILTMLSPQLSILIMIGQRWLLSRIYKDEKDIQNDKNIDGWSGWSIPLLPFLVLLIPMEQKQLNRHIDITNIVI